MRELPPSRPGRLVLAVAEMVIHLAFQRRLDHPPGQLGQQAAGGCQRNGEAHKLAAHVSGAEADLAQRAAALCKADLVSEMVGEFPELQGTMGKYYAAPDESPAVAKAIEEHYLPRTGGGELPRNRLAVCVALADRIDMLVGIYGIGLVPTGDKEPFALRRSALGAIRILAEHGLPLDALDLLHAARALHAGARLPEQSVHALYAFMLERFRSSLREQGFAAVCSLRSGDHFAGQEPHRGDRVPHQEAGRAHDDGAPHECPVFHFFFKGVTPHLRRSLGAPDVIHERLPAIFYILQSGKHGEARPAHIG